MLALVAAAALAATTAGCGSDDHIDSASQGVAISGPWVIPPATLTKGDQQNVPYTSAGPWKGTSGCGGGILPGAAELREYLLKHFPQAYHIGGYACRTIRGDSSKMSLHATGRALDIMIRTINGDADNTAGDVIGNWLIENAQYIGIQYIIWDRWTWMAARKPGAKDRAYGGASPHLNHLHVEVSVDAAAKKTPWFTGPKDPPNVSGCEKLDPAGGVIDNTDTCFVAYGKAEYWRRVQGEGIGGSLIWTNAYKASEPGNWARWTVRPSVAGDYRVEVHVVSEYAKHQTTRYVVRHDGNETTKIVDLSKLNTGWHSLGELRFATSGAQDVSVYDNESSEVPKEQRIVVDALRLTRLGASSDDAAGGSLDSGPAGADSGPVGGADAGVGNADASSDPSAAGGNAQGGCNVARAGAGRGGGGAALLLLAALALLLDGERRRRRRRARIR